jgi:UDP-GlcNAc:undecaprenyl-phosphate/decaprenyl-phosphate GlcNAc-1-phosphate transferase
MKDSMLPIVFPAIAAFLLTLLLTPFVRRLSLAIGWVDRPDQRRKLHGGAIPRTGGFALLLSYVISYTAFLLLPSGVVIAGNLATVLRLLPALVLIFGTGLIDDRLDLRPWQKLAGEVVAAVWMWNAGVRIGIPGQAQWLSLLVTVGWLILCANAFNLIDGVDGLAAGVGLTVTLTSLAAALLHGDTMLALATAPLAASLLGFLPYNFNPASIFLGDSGSLSIGFLLGTYAVMWGEKSATLLGIAAPALALALPLIEVGLSIARRFLRNEPIFEGDRGHIHHRLLDRGFTPRRVALMLYGAGGVAAILSLARNRFPGLVLLLFVVVAYAGVRYLSYAEFRAVARFVRSWLRPVLGAQVQVELLERSLRSAADVGECWTAIAAAGRGLGYGRVVARLNGYRFASCLAGSREAWQMRVNLSGGDYVNISQFEGATGQPRVLGAFVDAIGNVLPGVLASLRKVEAGALGGTRVKIAPGGRDRCVPECRLHEVDGGMPVERVAGMSVPHPMR